MRWSLASHIRYAPCKFHGNIIFYMQFMQKAEIAKLFHLISLITVKRSACTVSNRPLSPLPPV